MFKLNLMIESNKYQSRCSIVVDSISMIYSPCDVDSPTSVASHKKFALVKIANSSVKNDAS